MLTPQWLDFVECEAKVCRRLALQLGMLSASGYSRSGWPWIMLEISMQKIVWTARHVEGRKLQNSAAHHDYRDVAVSAFPALEGKQRTLGRPEIGPKAHDDIIHVAVALLGEN